MATRLKKVTMATIARRKRAFKKAATAPYDPTKKSIKPGTSLKDRVNDAINRARSAETDKSFINNLPEPKDTGDPSKWRNIAKDWISKNPTKAAMAGGGATLGAAALVAIENKRKKNRERY